MAIVLDLYQGAYGPTLRIDTHDPEELRKVVELFEALATQATEEVDVLRSVIAEAGGVSRLLMSRVSKSRLKTLTAGALGPQGTELRWSGTSEYWQECLEKAQVLVADGESGHQYLTIEGVDDVLVELCYLETPP